MVGSGGVILVGVDGRAAVIVPDNNVNLDITWLRDPDMGDGGNLPPHELIVQEILECFQIALEEFAAVAEELPIAKAEREART